MNQRFRMTPRRWAGLLWVSSGKPLAHAHAIQTSTLHDLRDAGLIQDAGNGWEVTPTMGKGVIEMERQHLGRLCRQEHGLDVSSIYFDTYSQRWIANLNTPKGTDLAYVDRDGKDKIAVFYVR